ncbi:MULTISPECIES: SusC/RagA family TonB-linked outer membrane protein [Olivibacter]|uniref:SusC/RagA family TonB-linked outer membrane protein n=1 Tax=Olivibacter jilunii TaxID=985016 RepID=A0ABW6B5F5_9SPHI
MIKTEPIENSKSDRRLAEKEPQITRKLPQLVGKWVRPASVTAPNAVKMTRTVGKLARTTFLGRRSLRRLLVMNITCTFFPQKGTQKLLAAKFLCKLLQLLSLCYPKFWRSVISCLADIPSRPFRSIFGKSFNLTLGQTAIFRDEQPICSTVLGRTTVNRDKQQGDSSVIESFNYPNNKGRTLGFFSRRELIFLRTFGKPVFLKPGRNTICRDKQPICSTVLGRTTVNRDELRFWASASNDKRLAEKAPRNARKLPQLVGKGGRPASDERRDAANAMPKAVNRGRNAGTEGQNTIWRGQNASLCFSLSTTLFCAFQYLLGRTAILRDERRDLAGAREQSLMMNDELLVMNITCTFPRERYPKLLAAKFLCKLLRLLSLSYPTIPVYRNSFISIENKHNDKNFWRPVISRRTVFPLRPCHEGFGKARWYVTYVTRNAGKLWRNTKKFRRNALAQWRDATKGVPNSVNRGRNTIWRGRNAFNGERNAKKIWRNAKKFRRNASALTRGAIPSRDRFFGLLCKWALRTLKPYTIYLTALNVLFCVCLAHARQSSSPEAAHGVALQSDYFVTGRVMAIGTDETLTGATVRIKGSTISVRTDANGLFRISAKEGMGVLVISFLGYKTQEVDFQRGEAEGLTIHLEPNDNQLDEVEVSTGYQTLPKERATGSFVQVDKELFNRSVSTDVISRLKGVTPSLTFDERAGGEPKLSIRGRSTIFANDQPLIVVDNFPYEGDINNLNPNDIESISILRDAAAASIWGVRAGNGVIVVTTKRGRENQPISIEFNANTTLSEQPDLHYERRLGAADFIGMERFLYDKGFFNNVFNNNINPSALSPVVELLKASDMGLISDDALRTQLSRFEQYDVLNDLGDYFYRRQLNQQYALSISGGGNKHDFRVSAGYDHNALTLEGNNRQRYNIGAQHNITPFKNFSITTSLNYSVQHRESDDTYQDIRIGSRTIYPYARLTDHEGNALAIPRLYRESFIESEKEKGVDWSFFPLNEMGYRDNRSKLANVRFNTGLHYQLIARLNISLKYQLEQQTDNLHVLWNEESYAMRSLYNQYIFKDVNGNIESYIPKGGLLIKGQNSLNAQNIRGQIAFEKLMGNHNINLLAGAEIRENKRQGNNVRYYGYDVLTGTSLPVNLNTLYPQYPSGGNRVIPSGNTYFETTDRFRSFFFNGAYSYKERYTLSLSGRVDQSNLFGVRTNQKRVPLWSVGGKWNLLEEEFFNVNAFSKLNLRTTYGVSGNLDNSLTAFTTASLATDNYTGQQAATITNPANPSLRWEKISTLNFAVDYGLLKDRINGSVEYYKRRGTDLIGNGPLDPTNGWVNYRGNVADMVGEGWDIEINALLIKKSWQWSSALIFSYVKDKVTKYNLNPTRSYFFIDASLTGNPFQINPIVGKPVYGVYSYAWAGLDPETGAPRGYLNGEVSQNYSAMLTAADEQSLIYNGRAQPAYFGAFRNTFSYKSWNLSANIMYKLGYVFRRQSINYNMAFQSYVTHVDYTKRWQRPGDEFYTDVPAMIYPANTLRDNFYANSEVLIEKGDHIRLQDIQLSYDLNTKLKGIRKLQLYLYANNLGIIWRANKQGLDPDISAVPLSGTPLIYPNPRSYSLGCKIIF